MIASRGWTLLPVLLPVLGGCGGATAPRTPQATCGGGTVAGPASWAPWQVSATLTAAPGTGPAAVPTVEALTSGPYSEHPGEDPAAPRVWRCDGYVVLHLELTRPDLPPGSPLAVTLPRTPCSGDRVRADAGTGVLTLVERTSWCSEDLGGGSEAGFDGWWVDVTAAQAGTYTWTRDTTWTRFPAGSPDPAPPAGGSGRVEVTAVLAP